MKPLLSTRRCRCYTSIIIIKYLLKTKDTMNSLGNRYIKSNTKIFICKHFSKRRNAIGKENERADCQLRHSDGEMRDGVRATKRNITATSGISQKKTRW